MFHRAIGKITFPLIAIAFVALSVQTTWQFLNDALPHENWLYKVLGLAVFELGAFCWFSLLTSGAENVLRTIIALIMTVLCVAGVGTAAVYEIGSQMVDLGFKMDPSFLQWAPICVLVGFVSTLISTLLYMASSPRVAHRFAHMDATGQEPPIGSYIQMLSPTPMQGGYPGASPALPTRRQQRQLPPPARAQQPSQNQQPPAAKQPVNQVRGAGLIAGVTNWFGRMAAHLSNGAATYTAQPADEQAEDAATVDANAPVEQSDGAQEIAQDGEQEADTEVLEEATLMQSAAPATRPAAPAARKRAPARRSQGDTWELLDIISAQMPEKTNADLARMVGCDVSTVRRWRADRQPAVK